MVTINIKNGTHIGMPENCNVCPFVNCIYDQYGDFSGFACVFTGNETLCCGKGDYDRPPDCPIISIEES